MTGDREFELERFKAEAQRDLKRYEVISNTLQMAAKGSIDFAMLAIRSLIFSNGGAIVGIVTFTGNIWSRQPSIAKELSKLLVWPIGLFSAGLVCALLTAGGAYVAQVLFSEFLENSDDGELRPSPWAERVRIASVALAILSLATFIWGAVATLNAFKIY